tara:strand:- start:315 stop:1049 length:735 start_codon:yes stop_codon:yes gene_type:complete
MHKNIFFLTVLFLITSCSQNNSQSEESLSSLIKPSFTYKQDFFNCSLNDTSSLITLESFLSNVIQKSSKADLSKLQISILFPENVEKVKDFIISFKSLSDHLATLELVNLIKEIGIEEIALCNFAIYQRRALDFISYENLNIQDFTYVEILRCKYNENYNYGTFKIAIDRFINQINSLDLAYSLSYINSATNNNFIWINEFYDKDYQNVFLERWVNIKDATEIKDEFIENASCLDSRSYKKYIL